MFNYLQNTWYEISHADRLTWKAWGYLLVMLAISFIIFIAILKLAAYLRVGKGDYFV